MFPLFPHWYFRDGPYCVIRYRYAQPLRLAGRTTRKETRMAEASVPKALKQWFVVHFAADILFAVPLFLFPHTFLSFLGWRTIDPFATRIVAAALFGIGIESFLGRHAGPRTYINMLNLKLIWSGATILGIFLTLFQAQDTSPVAQWLVLMIFIAFHILWFVWRVRIGNLLKQ